MKLIHHYRSAISVFGLILLLTASTLDAQQASTPLEKYASIEVTGDALEIKDLKMLFPEMIIIEQQPTSTHPKLAPISKAVKTIDYSRLLIALLMDIQRSPTLEAGKNAPLIHAILNGAVMLRAAEVERLIVDRKREHARHAPSVRERLARQPELILDLTSIKTHFPGLIDSRQRMTSMPKSSPVMTIEYALSHQRTVVMLVQDVKTLVQSKRYAER